MRTDSAGDQSLPQFCGSEAAKPLSSELLKEGGFERSIERDEARGVTRYRVVIDSGLERLTDHGWESGSTSTELFEISDEEPNSNKGTISWTSRCNRQDMDLFTRTETRSILRSTPSEFLFYASLEAFEAEKRVYFKEWEKRFPRDLN